jgi:membrane protease YdiL (CAAX protease family)
LLGSKLNIDWEIAFLTIVSTLLIMADYYFSPTGFNYLDSLLLYILIPWLCTRLIFKKPLSDFGFKLGNWKLGLVMVVIGCLVMAPIIWYLASHYPSMGSYYRYAIDGVVWKKALEMFGWEYIFRGWLLFGYSKKYGPDALWLQAVPFAIAHIGKPALETFSTIFGGFAFGWVAWRTGSFLYGFLIHWFIGALIILVSSGALS